MPSYFGFNNAGTSGFNGNAGYLLWHDPAAFVYMCPGSGNQRIGSIEFYGGYTVDATKHVRVGVYSAAGALQCETGPVLVNGVGPAWWGVTTPGGTTPANKNLTGGAQYYLGVLYEDSDTFTQRDTDAGNAGNYAAQAYGAMPGTIPSIEGSETYRYCIRCGVDPVAVLEQTHYRWRNDTGPLVAP